MNAETKGGATPRALALAENHQEIATVCYFYVRGKLIVGL